MLAKYGLNCQPEIISTDQSDTTSTEEAGTNSRPAIQSQRFIPTLRHLRNFKRFRKLSHKVLPTRS